MSGIANIVLFRREVDGFFKILDKDLDGKLSFSEFLGEESHIERIFRTMDKNNDGFVSKEVRVWPNVIKPYSWKNIFHF